MGAILALLPQPPSRLLDIGHHAVDERLAAQRAFDALRPGGMCVTREPGAWHAATAGAIEPTTA